MIVNHIQKLINQGEHQTLEFKFRIDDSRKIARTLSAFSNSQGGTILVGVKDNGAIAGIRSDEEYYMFEAASTMFTKPVVNFKCQQHVINKKNILEVIIPESKVKPIMALDEDDRWKAFFRYNDQNFPANRIMCEVWKNEKNKEGIKIKFTDTEKILFDYLDKYNSITFLKFMKLVRLPAEKAEQIMIRFILLKIITIEFNGKNTIYKFNDLIEKGILKDYF